MLDWPARMKTLTGPAAAVEKRVVMIMDIIKIIDTGFMVNSFCFG
jgi:hypothetical protein